MLPLLELYSSDKKTKNSIKISIFEFVEKFHVPPPIQVYSPNTKSKIWYQKFLIKITTLY